MGLPPNYWDILQDGIAVLGELSAELSDAINREVARPEQELTLRDVSGLAPAGRDHARGMAHYLGGFRVHRARYCGALRTHRGVRGPSPYRDDREASRRRDRAQRLRALRDFLEQWNPAEFSNEIPEDFDALADPSAEPQHRDQQ